MTSTGLREPPIGWQRTDPEMTNEERLALEAELTACEAQLYRLRRRVRLPSRSCRVDTIDDVYLQTARRALRLALLLGLGGDTPK
jgi:hypothetical protein